MASGIFCSLYYNSNTYASPTWALIDHISSGNLKESRNAGNTTIRKNGGLATSRANLLEIEYTAKLLVPDVEATDTDGDFTNMFGFWNLNAVKDWLILTGSSSTNGAYGRRLFGQIHEFSRDEGDDVELYYDFTIKAANVPQAILAVTAGALAAQQAKVAGGVLTYAALGSNTFA